MHRKSFIAAFERELDQSHFINGPSVAQFEAEFSVATGARNCVGVGNGLDALRLTLSALEIGEGDEVIVPAQTFAATLLAVSQSGAIPVPVDVSKLDTNLDPLLVEKAITPKTKAILAVHLHGFPADIQALSQIARSRGIFLVEDAAQAHGLLIGGYALGHFSDAVAYSFYPSKNMGALGDAGCVTTNDDSLARRIRQLANYGSSTTKYSHELPGWNSRLDSIQASFLSENLSHLVEWNLKRADAARMYLELIDVSASVSPLHHLSEASSGVWHHFIVLSDNRNELRKYLSSHGVETELHYPFPAYSLPAFSQYDGMGPRALGRFTIADSLAEKTLSLPLHPWITAEEVAIVSNLVNQFRS